MYPPRPVADVPSPAQMVGSQLKKGTVDVHLLFASLSAQEIKLGMTRGFGVRVCVSSCGYNTGECYCTLHPYIV